MTNPRQVAALQAALSELMQIAAPPPAEMARAAVAVVIGFERDEPRVLLMRRAERPGDRWSGQIGLPGGHEEGRDADLLATARRETHEELGFDLQEHATYLGALPPVQARARSELLPMWIHPLVFLCRSEPAVILGSEASEAFWLPLAQAWSGRFDAELSYKEAGQIRNLPCWQFEDRQIWGLTYRMLHNLLKAWRPALP